MQWKERQWKSYISERSLQSDICVHRFPTALSREDHLGFEFEWYQDSNSREIELYIVICSFSLSFVFTE